MRSWVLLSAALALVGVSACGGSTSRRPDTVEAPRSIDAPLVTWIPEGGEFIASFRLAALFREPATRAIIDGLFPAEKIESFRRRTGIDPASVDEFVFGKFPGAGMAHMGGRLLVGRRG